MPFDPPEHISTTAAAFLADACETAPYGLCILDRDLTLRYVNQQACRMLQDTRERLLGAVVSSSMPHLGRVPRAILQAPFLTGEISHILEYPERIPGDAEASVLYWNATFSPVRQDGVGIAAVLVQLTEVTDEVRARQAEHEHAAALEAVIETITEGLAIIDAEACITRMNRAGQAILQGTLPKKISLEEFACLYAVRELETDHPVSQDALPATRALQGEVVLGRELLLRNGLGVDIAVVVNAAPLRDPMTGADNGAVMTFRDVTQINELRAEATVAFTRLDRIAQTLQQSLMPEMPIRFPDHSLGFAYEAAWIEEADIGGDFFDVFWVNPKKRQAHFVLGDVSGKGLAAARRTASIRYTIRALASAGMRPQAVIGHLNDVMVDDSHSGGFATLIYGIFDILTGHLSYVNAGHEPGLIWQGGKKTLVTLKPCGLPLGIFRTGRDTRWVLRYANLTAQDSLLLFTDGLTEALAPGLGHDFFGPKGVRRAMREAVRLPDAEAGVRHIVETIHTHSGARLRDDLAILLLRGNSL